MISSKLREIDRWNWLHMWVIGCRLLFFGKSRVRNSQWFWGQSIEPFNHSDAGLRWVDAESLRIKEGKFILILNVVLWVNEYTCMETFLWWQIKSHQSLVLSDRGGVTGIPIYYPRNHGMQQRFSWFLLGSASGHCSAFGGLCCQFVHPHCAWVWVQRKRSGAVTCDQVVGFCSTLVFLLKFIWPKKPREDFIFRQIWLKWVGDHLPTQLIDHFNYHIFVNCRCATIEKLEKYVYEYKLWSCWFILWVLV